MGTTTFSGPVKAGTIRQGASANIGTLVCAQSAAITETLAETTTGIIIPANSQIINFYVLIQTAWDGGTNTLDIGVSGNADLYCDGLPATGCWKSQSNGSLYWNRSQLETMSVHPTLLSMLILLQQVVGHWCFDGSIPSK